MTRAIRPTLLLLLVAAAITMALLLTGVLGSSGPTPAGAATASQQTRTHPVKRHTARHHSKTTRAHSKTTRTAQTADTDNVQSGDQTAPDNPSGENESAGENENASEPAGEAQPGHEDPQGQQVDHQCPPDCAPGELP